MKRKNVEKRRKGNPIIKRGYNNTNNNKVIIAGIVVSNFEFYGRNNCGGFYKVKVETVNLQGKKDVIPVVLSEVFIADINKQIQNKYIKVKGKYRSFTKEDEKGQRHLEVFVLASDITFLEKELYENKIYFDGYLCDTPKIRYTPLGYLITDVTIAVNRDDGTGDYIRCISWGRTAKKILGFKIGEHVSVYAQIRSRKFLKKNEEGTEFREKEINEVSVKFIKKYT